METMGLFKIIMKFQQSLQNFHITNRRKKHSTGFSLSIGDSFHTPEDDKTYSFSDCLSKTLKYLHITYLHIPVYFKIFLKVIHNI
jgi:hypothetical protein